MVQGGQDRGAPSQPHTGEGAMFSEALITDGGTEDAGPENILSYAKMIGKHCFSDSLAAGCCCILQRRERERDTEGQIDRQTALAGCSLTANEGENVFPARVSPHRIH